MASTHTSDVMVKKTNINYHNVEAEVFERLHPEGSSIYEMTKATESIAFILSNSNRRDLCLDVGCGTGFITGFEIPKYSEVIALDISIKMVETVRIKFSDIKNLHLLNCDAESLPLKKSIVDLASVSSVLHHLPRPFSSLDEITRILRKNGFIYITREPNQRRFRRYFDFFDFVFMHKFEELMKRLGFITSLPYDCRIEGFDPNTVDVHYSTGMDISKLTNFLESRRYMIYSAYSYHWIFPHFSEGLFYTLLSKSNFLIGRIPLSNKLGRFINIIAMKQS